MVRGGKRNNSAVHQELQWVILSKGVAMDGSTQRRCSPLAVQREFVGFRLEKQAMVRVYELVVPLLLTASAQQADAARAPTTEQISNLVPLAKGA